MKARNIILLFAAIMAVCSCSKKKINPYDELGSSGKTLRTENLQANIKTYASKGTIIGQLNATIEGIGWQCDSDRSDIHEICGDRPAAVGYELASIESGKTQNADGLPFSGIREDILKNSRRGALVTLTWTAPDYRDNKDMLKQYVNSLAKFINSLHDNYGIKAPVVLFLYPINGNTWYTKLSEDDYEDLYDKTRDMLDDADVTNVVYGYSEAYPSTNFLERLPDDVDVVNATVLQKKENANLAEYTRLVEEAAAKGLAIAQDHSCAFGMTTGMESITEPTVFTEAIIPLIKNHRLSYLMFGANHGDFKDGHFYTPYPGEGNESIQQFVKFYNDEHAIFMKNLNGLYLKHEE